MVKFDCKLFLLIPFLLFLPPGPWTAPLGDYASAWVKVTEGGDPYYPDVQFYLSPASFSMDMGLFLPYIYNYDQAVRPASSLLCLIEEGKIQFYNFTIMHLDINQILFAIVVWYSVYVVSDVRGGRRVF